MSKMHILPPSFRVVLLALASCSLLQAGEWKEPVLKDVKGMTCPVRATDGCSGDYCSKKVKRDITAEHEGRKVYFCCKGCVKDFKQDPKAYLEEVKLQWKVIDSKVE